MKIYLAGPLFTSAEREFNVSLALELRTHGHEVWLPQDKEPREKTEPAIFAADVAGLEWCNVVVANMDGPDPDSGTAWECGYAYEHVPIVLFRTDFRNISDLSGTPFNLMLSESADAVLLLPMLNARCVAEEVHAALLKLRS